MDADVHRRAFEAGDPQAVAAVDEVPLWSAPFGLALLETVKLLPGMTVLDVGSGTGFPLLELASRLGIRGEAVGLDPWEPGLLRARAKVQAYGLANVRLVAAPAEAMPFEDRSFDLIVSNNGLNNVSDARRALAECARVAVPRGQLALTANLPGTFSLFYELFQGLLEDQGLQAEVEALQAHIRAKRRTAGAWRELVEGAGFAIRKTEERSFTWSFLDGTALFRHWGIRLAFLPPWTEVLPAARVPEFMPFLEGRLNRLALERGGLHLEVPFLCLDAVKA